MPKVMVCLPVYNGMQYIDRCISSVLSQAYSDFDFCIFVNKSSDGTLQACERYKSQDARIRVFPSDDFLSATENFQRAWDLAERESDYYLIIAHDDYINQNYLSDSIAALESDKSKFLAAPSVSFIHHENIKNIEFDKNLLNLDTLRTPFRIKRISFPASWFYGVYRKGSEAIIREALELYPDGWGVDRLCVQLFLLRAKIIFCEGARIFVQTGSSSAEKYMQKTLKGQLKARQTYFRALWSQRHYLGKLSALASISFWLICFRTSAHDTNYTIERILLRKR